MIIIPIKFLYGVEWEVKRVLNTLETKDWLIENGYRFSLPSGSEKYRSYDVNLIEKSVKEEYNPINYQTAEAAINKSWSGNCHLIKEINKKMIGSDILNNLDIILTKYGTQGSYIQPNSIIINISAIPPEFLIKTVIHESLHLMIESQIKKYAVNHWIKERIVDLIMDLEFKSRFKMGSHPEWAATIDLIFKEHYPNLDLIMKKSPHAPSGT